MYVALKCQKLYPYQLLMSSRDETSIRIWTRIFCDGKPFGSVLRKSKTRSVRDYLITFYRPGDVVVRHDMITENVECVLDTYRSTFQFLCSMSPLVAD